MKPTKRFHMITGIHSKIRAFQSREGHPKETFCVYTDHFPLSGYQPLPLVHLLILLMDSICVRDRGFPD